MNRPLTRPARRRPWKSIALATAAVTSLSAPSAFASSHREAPLIAEDPTCDSTDFYAFRSPDAQTTVTFLANYIPFQEPAGPPNMFNLSDSALYAVKIDNDDDAIADISYELRFTTAIDPNLRDGRNFLYNVGPLNGPNDPDQGLRQTYSVTRVEYAAGVETSRTVMASGLETAGAFIGPRTNGNKAAYEAYAAQFVNTVGTHKVFVGPRDDPFFIDINPIFDLLNISHVDGLGDGNAVDGVAGFNVHTIAIQVPITELTADGSTPVLGTDLGGEQAVIGSWTTCSRPKHTSRRLKNDPRSFGEWVQVSRLGLPLVNEVVIPMQYKDQWNRDTPRDDLDVYADFLVNVELSRLLDDVLLLQVPAEPRDDIVSLVSFLPTLLTTDTLRPADMLRLNLALPSDTFASRLGVIAGDTGGFPNGRRLGDDVLDISERVVGGGILAAPNTDDRDGNNVVDWSAQAPNNALNDGVDANDVAFLAVFPYAATPHEGVTHAHDDRVLP